MPSQKHPSLISLLQVYNGFPTSWNSGGCDGGGKLRCVSGNFSHRQASPQVKLSKVGKVYLHCMFLSCLWVMYRSMYV